MAVGFTDIGNVSAALIAALRLQNWGNTADLLTNQAVQDPKVPGHCHITRAQLVGIEPTSPPTKVVALPTKPRIRVPQNSTHERIGVWLSWAKFTATDLIRS